MYPFYNNPYGPFGLPMLPGFPFSPFVRRKGVNRLDQHGIYEVCTTGIVENLESESTVDYGINRRVWNSLPCECVIVWKVRHPVTQNGANLPVTVVVPSGSSDSTVASPVSGSKIPVVDNKGTQVAGHDVTVPTGSASGGSQQQVGYTTEHWVYINKPAGIFRLMGVTAQNSPVASSGNASVDQPSSKSASK